MLRLLTDSKGSRRAREHALSFRRPVYAALSEEKSSSLDDVKSHTPHYGGDQPLAVSSAWYAARSRSSSSRFGKRKKTRTAPSRMATIPAV